MGKGSERRPCFVPEEELERRWRETFGGAVADSHRDTLPVPVTEQHGTGLAEQSGKKRA